MAEILVFSPDKAEAAHYWRLLTSELVGTDIAVASTIAEAKPYISTIPILVGWKFPKDLIGQAKSLRWIHKVSAGRGWGHGTGHAAAAVRECNRHDPDRVALRECAPSWTEGTSAGKRSPNRSATRTWSHSHVHFPRP